MKLRFLATALLCCSLTACDKVKELAGLAKTAAREKKIPTSLAKPEKPAVDPALQALVDQTPEGVLFRKDIPFPTRIEVRTTRQQTYKNALILSTSELGRQSGRLEGTLTDEQTCRREGDLITLTLGKKILTKPNPQDPEKPITQVIQDGKSDRSITLTLRGKTWQPDPGSDFHSRVWAEEIRTGTADLLIDLGVVPRTLWFGKKRLKIGDPVPLPQSHLPVIFGSGGSGAVTLVLEAIEPLNGHPCGVFRISGDYSAKNHQNPDGTRSDFEMTIQSGKVWLSLLYPLVLKEELETIQTLSSSGKGGPTTRTQGGIHLAMERQWTAKP